MRTRSQRQIVQTEIRIDPLDRAQLLITLLRQSLLPSLPFMARARLPVLPPAFLHPVPLPFRPLTTTATTTSTTTARLHPPASLSSLAHSVNTRTTTAPALLSSTLSHLQSVEPHLQAFLTLDIPHAQSLAAAVDPAKALPLAGVPIAVKDNICTEHLPTTAASALLDSFTPPYTATAVQRLLDAGAVLVGKTNLDEFGMGSSTENSAYSTTRNPWDLSRVPGGSSGGSAVAVAARMVPLAIGSDTGGSIRMPAAYCGVTGLKPSYGRVSRHGLLAYASSLDTVGPIAHSVADCALALSLMAGGDGMDSTTAQGSVPDYVGALGEGRLEGVVVGVVENTLREGVDGEVVDSIKEALRVLKGLGAEIRTMTLGGLEAVTAAYYVLAPAEASANLARYDGVRYGSREHGENVAEMYARSRGRGFGEEVRKRIMVGTYALSSGYFDAYYGKAQRVRAVISKNLNDAFASGIDVLVSPVTPTTAFEIGEKTDDALAMYLQDVMTIPASLAGLPALSVPCGFARGLPMGMQIMAPILAEEMLLRVGHAFQLATEHHLYTPDLLEENLAASAKV